MKLICADILKQWVDCWKEAVLAGALLMAVGRLISYIFNKRKSPSILLFANGVFVYYLLYVTLLMRSIGSRREVELIPFNSYELSRGDFHYLIENMLLFVPFGVLLYVNLYIYGRKCSIKAILLAALLTSVSIEFLQYAFSCGKSEIDDVLANVLGALIGYAISRLTFCMVFLCKNSLSRKNT